MDDIWPPRTAFLSNIEIGFDRAALVNFLNENSIPHSLGGQAAPASKQVSPATRITLTKIPKQSPRDFKPWETLPAHFGFISGVYMHEQAAREIADAEDWSDEKLQALLDAMQGALKDGSLSTHCRQTGMTIPANAPDSLGLVTAAGVNAWIEKRGATYRWNVAAPVLPPADEVPVSQAASASEPVTPAAVPSLSAVVALPVSTRRAAPANTQEDKAQKIRIEPQGGDSLTPTIWSICYDLKDAEKSIAPRYVMSQLKERADKRLHPLIGTTAGGVKYEYEKADERELNSEQLRKRIAGWKAKTGG